MGKKIPFPPELRGGRIGRGWYEDALTPAEKEKEEENAKVNAFFSDLLKDKIEEVYVKARQMREKSNG
jgi:hypothetical protein